MCIAEYIGRSDRFGCTWRGLVVSLNVVTYVKSKERVSLARN